ncbi:hypothetical protein [Alienimonas californiensis]|uniref:Uncharacterized protein n=1 Tax=Alienimonas californiensis TaxID=2527989 RepID=A0A517PC44_9PLAN|nr:hypothetical protein [Alienimonas californiensis]QDT16948.1 hypothetical protein CA12_30580 [Alienimonas californiensis]
MPNPRLRSHLPVGDLLDLAERPERPPARPVWLGRFVDAAAELFDPLSGLGRVGFRSEPGEDGWAVALFLGATEIVGGPGDGTVAPARFRFDAAGLAALFDEPPAVSLEVAPPQSAADADTDRGERLDAALTLVGTVEGHALSATVLSVPPAGAEPGFKRYANGLQSPLPA